MLLHTETDTDTGPGPGPAMHHGRDPEDRVRPGPEPEVAPDGISEDQDIDFVTLGMFIIGMRAVGLWRPSV